MEAAAGLTHGCPVLGRAADRDPTLDTPEVALAQRYDDSTRCAITQIEGLGHALAEEPGIDPAPQTPHAEQVDKIVVAWLRDQFGRATT